MIPETSGNSADTFASNPTHHTPPLPLPPRKPASTAPDTTIWPANLALKPHPRDRCPAERWQWGCRTASSGRRPSQRSLRAAHLGNVGGNRIPAMAHANRTTFGQAPECTTCVLRWDELTSPCELDRARARDAHVRPRNNHATAMDQLLVQLVPVVVL